MMSADLKRRMDDADQLAKYAEVAAAAADLLATIELYTDCMTGDIERQHLDADIDRLEAALNAIGMTGEVHH